MAAPDPRPDLGAALDRLLVAVCAATPELRAIDARAVLVVALSAQGTIAASVRGLDDAARKVSAFGRARRWEIGLRPPFLLGADPSSRLATLVHELLHIDPAGGLLDARRHRHRAHDAHEAHARTIARPLLDTLDPALLLPLGHHGEALLPAWRVRPSTETKARTFTSRDLFLCPVVVETPARRRTVWW